MEKHIPKETLNKMSESSKGQTPINSKKIIVDNILYSSINEAGKNLGLKANVVSWRINSKNPKFNNYKYI